MAGLAGSFLSESDLCALDFLDSCGGGRIGLGGITFFLDLSCEDFLFLAGRELSRSAELRMSSSTCMDTKSELSKVVSTGSGRWSGLPGGYRLASG